MSVYYRVFGTSNWNIATEPPKIDEAKCNQKSIETPDDKRPPRYRYSLRLANMAAPEKQANAIAVPMNALTKMLRNQQSSIQRLFNWPA
ncbi:hypothetical protein Hanom_Chr03g00270911 [Helianthus anomalus]